MRLLVLSTVLLATVASMPFDVNNDAVFSDNFARTRVLPLCAATKNADPSICLNNQFKNAELRRRLHLKCSPYYVDKCVGYTAALHDDQAIAIAFEGTQGIAQLLLESDETIFANHTQWVAGGTVSKYFADGFYTLWNGGMKDDVLALKNTYPSYKLWVVGHSLGGAMASLAASYIVNANIYPGANVRLVTFGQPRTGDVNYANSVDQQIDYAYRIIHAHDIVPHLPPDGVEKYHHHHTEIYYNNDMSTADYVVCKNDETLKCSDGKVDTSVADHSLYYKPVTDWGIAGCPNN